MSRVYWERQGEKDGLCAVHCLNALLQRPVFNPVLLAEYGRELDREEAELMQGDVDVASCNVDAAGLFSSQTLLRALQNYDNSLHAVDSMHEEVRADVSAQPAQENAFICNRRKHWLAIRKLAWSNGEKCWFNLDSRLPTGPAPLDASQLTAMLKSLHSEGHTVWVVRGLLPTATTMNLDQVDAAEEPLESHQMFMGPEDLGMTALDVSVSHHFLDLAKNGEWDDLISELGVEEQLQAAEPGQKKNRYVDHIPAPRRFGLIHYAAHQGRKIAVQHLLFTFNARPDLLTAEGESASDLATGPDKAEIQALIARALKRAQLAKGSFKESKQPPAAAEQKDDGCQVS